MPPRRACDLCYKRKIQCLIRTQGEPCDWCKSQELECTFDRVITKGPNKRATADFVQELSHRVEELEDALRAAQQLQQAAGTVASGVTPGSERQLSPQTASNSPYDVLSLATIAGEPPPSNLWTLTSDSVQSQSPQQTCACETASPSHRLSRCQLGNNWYFKGVGILSSRGQEWISYGAGQDVFLEKFEIFDNPISTLPELVSMPPTPSRMLPPEFACRHLDLIEITIARAYDTTTTTTTNNSNNNSTTTRPSDLRQRTTAEACLWAVFALVNRTVEETATQTGFMPEARDCALEAKRLLFAANGSVDLDSLQANLLLWAYHKMQGRCREASAVFTSACRMVCGLGGHILLKILPFPPQHLPLFDERSTLHIRRLFCLCYCFDKESSLRTGVPPLLTEDYCDVSDPGDWATMTTVATATRLPASQDVVPPSSSHYNHAWDLRLAKFKEKAGRLLCSPRAFQYTEGELLSQVRQLDDELEEWRLSIEPRFRPKLSVPPSSTTLANLATGDLHERTRHIHLQLDYLFTMIYIHITVRKCGDFERNLPDDLHSAVHSSADLSLEASRSIFRYLHTVVAFWEQESVWVVSHYAPIATMPLFVNVLIHPVGNPADDDLQILASISNITRKIPTRGLSKAEIEQIQEIGEFVMELIRLCHSAAWKVKKGDREKDLDIIYE